MNRSTPWSLALIGAVSLAASGTSLAAVVYEASFAGTGSLPYFTSPLRYGDEISLAGTERILTEFSFSYYSDYAAVGGLSFTLYANNGTAGAPGSVLYSSSYNIVPGTDGVDIDIPFIPDYGDPLPNTFTWTVQFNGSGTAGLLVADAPTIGTSRNDFWELQGSTWVLRQLGGGLTSTFEAQVTAVAVPEPGTVALAVLGLAIGVWGFRNWRPTGD